MKEKQLIERALPFSHSYQYQGITHGNIIDGQFTICDNCGKIISHIVTLYSQTDGKRYSVGVDCTETLIQATKVQNGINHDYRHDIYSYNQAQKVAREIKKGNKATIVNGFWIEVQTLNGKTLQDFVNNFKKYFAELLPAN